MWISIIRPAKENFSKICNDKGGNFLEGTRIAISRHVNRPGYDSNLIMIQITYISRLTLSGPNKILTTISKTIERLSLHQ